MLLLFDVDACSLTSVMMEATNDRSHRHGYQAQRSHLLTIYLFEHDDLTSSLLV